MRKAYYSMVIVLLVVVMVIMASGLRPLQAQSGLATAAATEDLTQCVENDQVSDIYSVAFSPDGRYLVANWISGTFRMWDVATGDVLHDFPIIRYAPAGPVAFSADGKYVLTALQQRDVIMWNVETGGQVHKFEVQDDSWGYLATASFSGDGKYVLIGFARGGRLWNAQTGAVVRDFLNFHVRGKYGLAQFSPDDKHILLSGGHIVIYDIETGKNLFDTDGDWASFSPDGKYFAVDYQLWDAQRFTSVRTFDNPIDNLDNLAFSSDGNYLWMGNFPPNEKPVLTLWEVGTGKKLHSFDGAQASFFNNNAYLLTEDGDKTFRVWDSLRNAEIWSFVSDEGMDYERLFISPDDKYVAIPNMPNNLSDPRSVHLLDIRTGQLVRRFC